MKQLRGTLSDTYLTILFAVVQIKCYKDTDLNLSSIHVLYRTIPLMETFMKPDMMIETVYCTDGIIIHELHRVILGRKLFHTSVFFSFKQHIG